jgi:membrane protein YdbS with pleckstrin-like domain
MPLLINKNGEQLGPYSLDEARALVLSGRLSPTDWAWPDNATEWIALKDVPGFSAAKPAASAGQPPPPTSTSTTEEELWRGHPSQILNFNIYFFWALVLIGTIIIVVMGVLNESTFWAMVILGAVALIALINNAVAYLHLHAIEYVVTTQRVRIISGIFSKDIQEIELFRVKDTMARQSFFLRLFGLGTITILSGDEQHPRLILSGVPKALELRERLRQEVMVLRQRFGIREVDVM